MQTNEAAGQSQKVTCMDVGRLANSVSEEMKKRRPFKPPAKPTIFRAPKIVRSSDPDAYEPKLVSIGPYHRAKSKADFKPMEELKWRLLDNYISKASKNGETSEDCIGRFLRKMKCFEKEARNCYSEVIDIESDDEFVVMLLLDGCFLVQILSSFSIPEERPEEITLLLKSNMWIPSLLFRDLILLENQIPYFVVEYLFNELKIVGRDVSLTALGRFSRFLPRKLGISTSKALPEHFKVHHFLHLFHWYLKESRKTSCKEPSPWRLSSALSSLTNKTRDRLFKMISRRRGASDRQQQEPLVDAISTGSSEISPRRSAPLIDEISYRQPEPSKVCASAFIPEVNITIDGSSVVIPSSSGAPLITPLFNETKMGLSEAFLSCSAAAPIDEIARGEVIRPIGSAASLITPLLNETEKVSSEVFPSFSEAALINEIAPSEVDITIDSVTALADAGIRLKARKVDNFLDISFHKDKGVLEIPAIMVDDHTNFILRNLIAFEQCYQESYHESNNTSTSAHEHLEMHVTNYTLFMDGIINTPRDVELLCKKGIILRNLGSDTEIATLFNKLGKGVFYMEKGNRLVEVYENVKDYCESPWHRHRTILMRDYFSNPWAFISVVAAAALLALTILQTVFSALSY